MKSLYNINKKIKEKQNIPGTSFHISLLLLTKCIETIPFWNIGIQTTLRILVDLYTFFLEVREISHLVCFLTTLKATIRTGKTLTQVFLLKSSTPRPIKRMSTSLGIFSENLILVPHGRLLKLEPLLRFGLTWFIHRRQLSIFIILFTLGILNLVSIQHEPRDIHIILEYCYTTLFPPTQTPQPQFFSSQPQGWLPWSGHTQRFELI